MKTPHKEPIEFCYHIKNRWPHHIKNKRKLESFQKMVFEAIDWEIEKLEEPDFEWSLFTYENSALHQFKPKEQALLLKRLKKALVENDHSFNDEDLILEDALHCVVVGFYEYISDCRDGFKKDWNMLKRLAGSEDEEDIRSYFKDEIWWDMDFTFWSIKPSHIKNYKKILKQYI